MQEFAVILISTIFVNNFVLVQFLGLCPFMGVSSKLETAIGMAGINAIENEHYFVANNTNDFIEAIQKLHDNPELIEKMGSNAKLFIEELK